MNKPNYQQQSALIELKQAYDNGCASVLVGAGFSLNVSNKYYLTWNGLLSDLIWTIDGTTLEAKYHNDINQAAKNALNIEEFGRKYVEDRINEIGTLEVASKYIRRCNNMHEAIDSYIENHIPYAEINDEGNVLLSIKGKIIADLHSNCLKLHNLLLRCNRFKSFFTTNYDNLLDLASSQSLRDFVIVKEGSQFSKIGNRGKIIKIHGSLRAQNETYGFDGCNKHHYIITAEDYSSYDKLHPAFSSILRSEMLQGVFCLIGFSGTDPNFRNCIDWLKQIMGAKDKPETKFYLIDMSPAQTPDYLNLFYENNYIKCIKLQDKAVQERLGLFDNKLGDNIFEKTDYERLEQYRQKETFTSFELLSALFKYIGKEQIETPVDNNQKEKNNPIIVKNQNPIIEEKEQSLVYRQEWEKGIRQLYKDIICIDSVEVLYKIKQNIRFFKNNSLQENVINHLMTKEPLTEEKAKLFALAVSDIGQIPSYYNNYHKDDVELNKLTLWTQLKEREQTLRGKEESIEIIDDASKYELIQRCLFHLDFSNARDVIVNWDAKDAWIQSKVMRMAVYPDLQTDAITLLKKTIEEETNPTEKLFEVILANFISRQWPRPYSTEEFWRYGIEGQGDLLNSMMSSLRGKEEKPKRRNWIGSTHHFGDNNGDYCKSLRILQFIIDSGIYLNLPGTYMFEIASWYKVFTNLYEHFPYPCFFYSIQYDDKDVLRRIGEDFAYNEGLQDFVQDILLKSLAAINNPDTPPSFKNGILNITAAMFVAVNEDLWFERFQETVFNEFCKNIKSKNDELLYNVKFAVGSIKRSDSIKVILQKLLRLLHENESVVSDIIVNNLMVDRLSASCLNDVDLHFENYLSPDTLDLLDTFHKANILPEGIRNDLVQVVLDANVDDIPKDRVALYQLTNLTCDNLNALEIVKQRYLSMDIWHCGVLSGNEFGWSEPHYIRLNLLNNKVSWNDEQFELIKQNLIKNVTAYDRVHETLHEDSFMKATQVRYLSDMLKYIDGLDAVRKSSLATVRDDVERLLADRTHYEDNIDFMMSDQSADVNYAFGNIYESVQARGVEYCKHDLDFLIDRAIMKRPIALTRNLRCIKFIMDSKSVEMLQAGYAKKLNKVLSSYLDSSSWQSLDLRFAFNYLRSIAKKLDEGNVLSEECSQFWLNNSFVKKFAVE